MAFQLPPDGIRFYADVVERSKALIQVGVWAGIHPARLRTWLNNFSTELERYFCACLLDSVIYRSEEQTNALTTQVFQRALPDVSKSDPSPLGVIDDWLALFCSTSDPGARIVPVLKPSDPAGKSGDIIARLLKRGFHVNPAMVIEPRNVWYCANHGIRTFVFIDDFLGTGQQFEEVMHESGIDMIMHSLYCVYAPLAAHTKGVEHLSTKYPTLKVCSGESLDWSHSLFHPECTTFEDGVNSRDDAKKFYYELLERKGVVIPGASVAPPAGNLATMPPDLRRGYGYLELAYVFQHSIPDNCLPALWWSRASNWNPLFNR